MYAMCILKPCLKISFWDVSFLIMASVDLVLYLIWRFQVMRTIDIDDGIESASRAYT
jgi:hypothetical protein